MSMPISAYAVPSMRWHLVLIGVGALICGGFAVPAIASLVPPERVASASAPVDELLTCAQVDEDMARLTAYRRSAITTRGIANSMAVSQGVAGVLMGEAMGMRFMQVQPGTPLHVATAGMRDRAYQKERFKIFDSLRRIGVLPGTDAGGLRGSVESPQ